VHTVAYTSSTQQLFPVGAQVLANFGGDGFWEPGKVVKINENGTFDIEYDDGDEEEGVPRENLKEWVEEESSDDSDDGQQQGSSDNTVETHVATSGPVGLPSVSGSSGLPQLSKCTFEVTPSDGTQEASELFEYIKFGVRMPGLNWIGYQTEPLGFGINILVPSCALEPGVDCDKASDMLQALEGVQSVSLRSLQSFSGRHPSRISNRILVFLFRLLGEPFEICSRIFVKAADALGAVALNRLHVRDAQQLVGHGYCVLDNFIEDGSIASMVQLASQSVAAFKQRKQQHEASESEGSVGEGEDGIRWIEPGPRTARSDVITWMNPATPPANDPCFATAMKALTELQVTPPAA
jgi:translation elongation factor EF-1beta